MFDKIAIIGMGLIGGSIGKAALAKGLAKEVVGVCRRRSSLDRAVGENSLTKGYVDDHALAVKGADLVIVATPVFTIKEIIDVLAAVVEEGVLVTDVGSTKLDIVEHAEKFADKFSFVGSHPIAGSDNSGVEFSTPDLFEGAISVVTKTSNTKDDDIKKITGFWEDLGSRVEVMDPEEHDKILAFTSHLPHIAAYALSDVQPEEYLKFTATGFKDTCRIAASDPRLWSEILISNKDNVLSAIKKYKDVLGKLSENIEKADKPSLQEMLARCKGVMDGLK